MKKYVAFLRGINISGKNKISMANLKTEFETLGYFEVSTYLNSGNIVFSTSEGSINAIENNIENMMADKFGFTIPVYVILINDLSDILLNAPDWWGTDDKDKYHNLIMILSDNTPEEISELLGDTSSGIERVQICDNIIYWTFDRKLYQKCNWWKKTASAGIADKLTIRTANTISKIISKEK